MDGQYTFDSVQKSTFESIFTETLIRYKLSLTSEAFHSLSLYACVGANVAGFLKATDAIMAQGVV